VGAIGALSNAGIQASRAGTGLTRVISNLEAPTGTTLAILNDLGVTADQVKVSSVGLTQAIKVLGEAGVDTGLALEIFGQRGGPAFEVLASSIGDVEKLTAVMGGAAGTANEIARAMDDNLKGSLLALRSSLEAVVLSAGESGVSGALRAMVDGLTGVFRFISSNMKVFQVGVVAASTAILVSFIPATTAATGSLFGFVASLHAAEISLIRFSRIARATPIGLLAAALAAVGIAIVDVAGKFDDLAKSMLLVTEQGEKFAATDFVKTGIDLKNALAGLARINKQVKIDTDAGREATEAQSRAQEQAEKKVKNLTAKYELFKKGLVKTNAEADAHADSLDKLTTSLSKVLDALAQENVILTKNSREREIQRRLISEVSTLEEESGTKITDIQRKQLELAIRRNTSMEEQAAILDDLKGSTIEFGFQAAALNELRRKGLITQEQFNEQLKIMKDEMREVNEVTKVNVAEQRRLQEAMDAKNARAFGFAFRKIAEVPLGNLAEAARLLDEMNAPAERFIQTQQRLELLFKTGKISLEQYTIALNNMEIATAEASTSAGEGASAGFARLENQILDISGAVEDTLVSAYSKAEDQLATFLSGGEADWSAFADSVLKDISKILIRQALIGALGLGGGDPLGGLVSGSGVNTRAAGGPVTPTSTFLVGEEGPELFKPPGNGTIVPANETATALSGGGQAPVNLKVVNVMDPSEVSSALNSPEGEQTIINIIRRNPDAVKQAIG
jgi:hypothetical protein